MEGLSPQRPARSQHPALFLLGTLEASQNRFRRVPAPLSSVNIAAGGRAGMSSIKSRQERKKD
jgi:hypothetical protein